MKITLLIHKNNPSQAGLYTVVKAHAHNLSLAGNDIQVFGIDELIRDPFRVIQRLLKSDVLHLHGLWTLWSLLCLALVLMKDKRIVISPHGMLDNWALQKSGRKKLYYWRLIEKYLFLESQYVHCLNEKERDDILSLLPSIKSKTVVIPNGVDFLKDLHRESSRKKIIFGYLGRLDVKKGVLELIRSFKELDTPKNYELKIGGFGHGPYFDECIASIKSTPSINYCGKIPHDKINEFLSQIDVFILPSLSEGLPMVILEAANNGCLVVMTRQCNLNDWYISNAALEIESSTESIKNFIQNIFPELELNRYKENARNIIEKRYQWSIISKELIKLYTE